MSFSKHFVDIRILNIKGNLQRRQRHRVYIVSASLRTRIVHLIGVTMKGVVIVCVAVFGIAGCSLGEWLCLLSEKI